MKKTIRLTEGDLHRIVKQVITETIDEYEMGLVGAYGAARNNLQDKMRLGYNRQVKPNGKIITNKDRIVAAKHV